MPVKKRTREEDARSAKIRELLDMSNITSMDDIQSLFNETIAEFMEDGLETEPDDKYHRSWCEVSCCCVHYGCFQYFCCDNRTCCSDVEVAVPRDRNGEFEPQLLKKNQTSISQDSRGRFCRCMPRA